MSLLSPLCCRLLLWLGLVEAARCDEWLRVEDSPSGEVTSLQWLKILFVPTLGLLILSLFMLEEHCQGQREGRKRRAAEHRLLLLHQLDPLHSLDADHLHSALSQKGRRRRGGDIDSSDPAKGVSTASVNGSRGRSASSASSQHLHTGDTCHCSSHHSDGHSHLSYSTSRDRSSSSSSSSRQPVPFSLSSLSPSSHVTPSSSPSFPLVLLMSEANQVTAYSLPPTLSLRDLLLFHSSRHNLTLDPVLVWVDGRPIDVSHRMNDSVERLGVVDGSAIRVGMDWKRMVEVLIKEEEREAKDREKEMASLRRMRVESQERASKMEAELAQLRGEEQRVRVGFEAAASEREEVAVLVRAAEERLRVATAAREEVEETKRERERESGSQKEKREKARLEEVIAATKKEMAELSRERGELSHKSRRVREENEEVSGKRKELDVKGDRIEREKEGWKRKVEGGEKTVLERLERAEREKEESGRLKAKMENSEREKDEKRQSKEESHRAIIQRIEHLDAALIKQSTRLKAAEKEAAEALKFRQLARQYEGDVKEAVRWKLLVKQGRVREKMLEKETKELGHWRQRAKAFEKEVRQLRSWRREVGRRERRVEGLEAGWGGSIPAFDYATDSLDGLPSYDGAEDWTADALPLTDDLMRADVDEDEAAIPPIDVITSQALSQSSTSSLSSRSSYTVSGSTLQPTAAPFIPRLSMPTPAGALHGGSAGSGYGMGGFGYGGWGAQGGSGSGGGLLIIDDRPGGGTGPPGLTGSPPGLAVGEGGAGRMDGAGEHKEGALTVLPR